jgi:hypothetical protein
MVACLAATLTLVLALPAQAQRDTGVMNVQALDPDGAPLPGVMVVARGPVGTQTQYTGVDGTARFPGLYPGAYTATFTLDGFKTIVREGLTIQAQRTTAFSMTMELATVEETVTVTGKSPVVDVKSANVAGLYTDDLINMSPTASGLWAGVTDHIPGIVSSLDVGGQDSGQQQTPEAWGSEWTNNSYNVNGGDTTDPAATGASSSYFSVGSFEEVSVALAGQDIEIRTPGINMNMVVKSGSNDWHAAAKYFYEGPKLVSNNVDAELEAQGVEEGTPTELLSDLDVQGGGPIWRDRAWFFVDYWNFEIQRKVFGLQETDGTELDDWTINLNGQIDDDNKISGRFIHTKKYRNNRGASATGPYLGWIQDSNTKIPQVQWQSVINQNVFTDIRYSVVRNNFPLTRRGPGTSESDVPYQNWTATWDFFYGQYLPRPANPDYEQYDERDTDNLNGTVSWYVTGERISHDIKFGANYTWINFFTPYNYPNGYLRYTRGSLDPMGNPNWMVTFPDDDVAVPAVPVEVTLYNAPIGSPDGADGDCYVLNSSCWYPDNAKLIKARAGGLFLQDTLTINNRLTIVAGLRFDNQYGWNPAQNRLDSPWCGMDPLRNPEVFCGGSFADQERPFTWNDLTPRVSLIYDVTGDGRWAGKFSYSRYAESLGTRFVSATNVNDVASEDWDWFDPNGDGVFQFGEQESFRSQYVPGLGTAIDPDLYAPMINEFTFGMEHELVDNVLLSVTGIIRGRDGDTGSVNIGRPFGPMIGNPLCIEQCTPTYEDGSPRPLEDPWVEVTAVDPGNDGIIGTPDDGGDVPVWVLDPATFGTSVNLSTNVDAWGYEDYSDYKGVSFVVSKRWSNNWQVLASYDYGKAYVAGASTSPNGLYNNRRQLDSNSLPHIFKFTGSYLVAEPIGVNLGVFVRAQSGNPVGADYTYSGSYLDSIGPFDDQGNTNIDILVNGEGGPDRPARRDFTTLVDFRAEKQVTIGKYGVLHFYFDVFNLFNANTITNFRTRLGSRYLEITNILPPRVMRLGGAWDF